MGSSASVQKVRLSLKLLNSAEVVHYNCSAEERETLVVDPLWETIHAEEQDFIQNTLATVLRTYFRKKKESSRTLSNMLTFSADWMTNTNKSELELQPLLGGGEESKEICYPRTVTPTAAQVHCLQFLISEVVSGGNLGWLGGFFGNSASEIPVNGLKQLENVLMPCDSAQQALVILKQRFLYVETEAEVDHCFDIFVSKLWDTIFTCYKSWAASELLDPSFLFALDNAEKYTVQPMRFNMPLKMTKEKLLESLLHRFPHFHLEDKVSLKGVIVMNP